MCGVSGCCTCVHVSYYIYCGASPVCGWDLHTGGSYRVRHTQLALSFSETIRDVRVRDGVM